MIRWDGNVVQFGGTLTSEDIFFANTAFFSVCEKQGYTDIVLDFSAADAVFETFMVPIVALCRNYRGKKRDFDLRLPNTDKLRSLFHNSNWAHLIDPDQHAASTFVGTQHFAAQPYRNSDDQQQLVDRIMEVVLGSLSLERKQLKALEWCINEITDNVLNHAQSDFGGVVQATTFATSNAVEFVVADAGIGIAKSLGEMDHVRALERAIQEGVTRNKRTNQGNGLYGSFRVATISGGRFQLHSGKASLVATGDDRVRTSVQKNRRWPGTAVVSQIVCRDERLIEEALVFRGRPHDLGHDFVEKRFEHPSDDKFVFYMDKESKGFGTREAGAVVRNKIMNILRAEQNYTLTLDFQDVVLISSSFADEAIAKPYVELGPMAFMARVEVINADRTVRALIDRAILHRSMQATLDDFEEG